MEFTSANVFIIFTITLLSSLNVLHGQSVVTPSFEEMLNDRTKPPTPPHDGERRTSPAPGLSHPVTTDYNGPPRITVDRSKVTRTVSATTGTSATFTDQQRRGPTTTDLSMLHPTSPRPPVIRDFDPHLTANIVQVGNAILPSSAGANWDGTTFLLNDVILKRGVIFAFSAYFVEVRPVKFQLWRPAGGTNLFVLLDEWQFVPTNKGQREDFYIHTQQDNKCVTIEETDRLGLYTAQSPGSVGFNFDGVNAQAYTYTERNLTLSPSIGDTVSFDALSYPYRFSAAAYIDTDMSSYANPDDPACPVALQIPYTDEELGIVGSDPITTQAPITGAPGQQGATGATGPSGNVGGTGPMGSMGATGASGPAGAVGATGPAGANGLPGDFGQPGPVGATGPQGPAGPAGPPGIAGPAVGSSSTLDQYEDCTWCWRIFNPYTNLGFLIWLLILTIVNIVLVVVVACRRRDQINYNSNLRWSGSQGDLWKTFEDQQSKAGYENGGAEPAYSYVEEGRTAF